MSNLTEQLTFLRQQEWIDLTHLVHPEIPYFPAFKPIEEQTLFTVAADGFYAKEYTLASQYGTHIDAPVHFWEEGRSLDELSLKELVLPLYVIHKEEQVKQNHDYRLSVEDILAFEQKHGKISPDSFVAFASGWSARFDEPADFYNQDEDGNSHTPGWSLEALKFLHEERQIKAIGHETLDTDAAIDYRKNNDLVGERYWLTQNNYQVEVLTNLSELPATGGIIFVGATKIKEATGFTARVFAIVPNSIDLA